MEKVLRLEACFTSIITSCSILQPPFEEGTTTDHPRPHGNYNHNRNVVGDGVVDAPCAPQVNATW